MKKLPLFPKYGRETATKRKLWRRIVVQEKENILSRDGSEFESKMTDREESFQSAAAPAMHPSEFSHIDFSLLRRCPTPSCSDAPGRIWGLIPGRGLCPCTIRSNGYLSDSRSQSSCLGCQP